VPTAVTAAVDTPVPRARSALVVAGRSVDPSCP